jgi:hypothetical protein
MPFFTRNTHPSREVASYLTLTGIRRRGWHGPRSWGKLESGTLPDFVAVGGTEGNSPIFCGHLPRKSGPSRSRGE